MKVKKVKSLLALILALILVFALAGCDSQKKKAENAVEGLMKAFQEGDIETISEYLGEEAPEFTEQEEDLVKAWFGNLEYKIISSEKEDDDTVIVTTEITAVDMEAVLQEYMQKVMEAATSGKYDSFTEEEMTEEFMKMLEECFTAEDIKTVTTEVDLTVQKDGSDWVVNSSEDLEKAFIGGVEDLNF